MSKITSVGKNALEDGVEDYFNALIYRRMRKFTQPFLKDYDGDSEFDEAMQSFIGTLSSGLALYAFTKVTSFFFSRGQKLGAVLWTFIVSGKIKKRIFDKIKGSKYSGNKLLKVSKLMLGADRTSDRIEISKMIQSNVDSYDKHKFHYQDQHQKSEKMINDFTLTGASLKNNVDSEQMELVLFKTKNALWKNTKKDKKLFEKSTGVTLSESGEGSWTNMHKQLNSMTDLFFTLEGEAHNLASVLMKVLAKSGAVR